MGRTVDQDVHQAFIEFRAKDDDKCLSVQCIYCQQIRAKNTSRQKQHLNECSVYKSHQQQTQLPSSNSIASNGYPNSNAPQQQTPGPSNHFGAPANNMMSNGVGNPHTPIPSLPERPGLPSQQPTPSQPPPPSAPGPSSASRPHATPKPKTPKANNNANSANGASSIPAPPLDDVHAAFVEFRAKEEDKCLSVQCIYCQQVRAKNTSRQRQHLLECPTYLSVMKDSIPANNLQHTFPDGDVARSLQIPGINLELDFRISIKLNAKIPIGDEYPFGQRNWIGFIGGSWAGRWGKGVVLPGGQDYQVVHPRDFAVKIDASYLLQTSEEPPAYITVKTNGWRTGSREILDKLNDPVQADTISPTAYKFRLYISMETGDNRYTHLNTAMWLGSGCRRSNEVIYDAFRIS